MKKVVAHGTFDILHYGHLNYLEQAKRYGDYLIVLVTSDALAKEHHKNPYFNELTRIKMVKALKCVDEVILRNEHITNEMLINLGANVLVTTDPTLKDKINDKSIEVIIIERTKGISTTTIKEYLKNENK